MKEENVTTVWKQFEKGLQWIKNNGLWDEWEECERFIEGDQWAKPTTRTKNLPRPVVNMCSLIAENKKSNILSSKVKMIFTPSEMFGDMLEKSEKGADIFTKFADNISKEIEEEELDDLAQDSAVQLGTYIYHYFWDTSITGGMQTPYVGGMRGEVLHPKNVIFANPTEKDEQKQKYIIISSIELVESVKALAKKNKVKNWESIKADNALDEENIDNLDMCTVLTKYSRQNGRVVWEKSTKYCQIQEPTYWEPDSKKIKLDSETDTEEIDEPNKPDNYSYFNKQLYPIVVQSHKSRKRCIYGIGEVKQAIPNNKAVNFNLAMMLLSVQQTGWPTIIQKANALAKQMITNEPGQILTDNTKGSGWGVKYLDSPGFNAQALTLTNTLIDLTRSTTGSTEVVTGEVLGANMAASAIIALQNQAKKPVEIYQKRFYRAYKKKGRIYEQFFKYYYNDGRMFGYEEDNQIYTNQMFGSEFKDVNFALNVEVGAGGMWSESLSIQLLDKLKEEKDISTDDYIDLYPESIMTFKTKLKKMREKRLMNEQKLLEQQLVQQDSKITALRNELNVNQGI